jgi:hypothetical protein
MDATIERKGLIRPGGDTSTYRTWVPGHVEFNGRAGDLAFDPNGAAALRQWPVNTRRK